MTFDTTVPNASQSPGIFPAQNNTNFVRLKTLINSDHVFNDTAQATDGVHRQVTLIDRAIPTTLPLGTNSVLYSFLASDSSSDLWFFNGTLNNQVNWRSLQGTCTMSSTFSNVVDIPPNCYGVIYMFRDSGTEGMVNASGTFASTNSLVSGFSYAQKFASGRDPGETIRFGFFGDGASGLTLRARNDKGIAIYDGVWQYRAFYRLIS